MKVRRCWLAAFSVVLSFAVSGCNDPAKVDPPIRTIDSPEGAKPAKESPAQYWVRLETTKGNVVIEVNRSWSPFGADRIHELVTSGFYDECRFYRILPGAVAQVGINGSPKVDEKWRTANIPDDPVKESNKRGYVSFAKSQIPNSRTTQIFFNLRNNAQYDASGFSPFGRVVEGLSVIDSLYDGYDQEPQRSLPRILEEGNAYLEAAFPKLDSIKKATILPKFPAG